MNYMYPEDWFES